MVLARIEGDPPGVKGLSIFIVPKYRLDADGAPGELNDVRSIGIEHKMGLKASPTTTMSFGEKGDCHGYLLGNACEGIKIMFHMMNASRLEVGIWGQGTSSVSYLHALDYAKDRKQGPSMRNPKAGVQAPIIDHPDIRRVLLMLKSYVEGMRAMLYYAGYAMDRAETAQSEEDRQRWHDIVEVMIPICKAYPTEKAVDIASHAIQTYGGYGYTQEYPVEQFMRDAKVACIFEGTTGIQAMDFALRKVGMRGGQVFATLLEEMDAVIDKAAGFNGWAPYAEQVKKTKTALADLPASLAKRAKAEGIVGSFLQATPFLDATGDLLVAYFLLWGAVVAQAHLDALCAKKKVADADARKAFIEKNAQAAFLAGKIESARFFIANLLPATDGKISAIGWGDQSAWEIAEKSF